MRTRALRAGTTLLLLGSCTLPAPTTPLLPTCADGQFLQQQNGTWACANAPAGLIPPPTQACGTNQVVTWTGSAWSCVSLPQASAPATCESGQFATFTGGAWSCVAPPAATWASISGTVDSTTSWPGSVPYSSVTDAPPAVAALATPESCPAGTESRWDGTQWDCDSLTECPPGYARGSETQFTVCTRTLASGQTDEMVKVGDFWIDRYEMSSCSGFVGASPGTGYDTTAIGCSVSGVQPQADITWFQAEQMCVNAGKQLCSNAEWQAAASGTYDPGSWPGSSNCGSGTVAGAGPCNTCSGGPRNTGLGAAATAQAGCYSTYGAEDMIGNLWEWVADWGEAGVPWQGTTDGEQTPANGPWPNGFGDGQDGTWNVNGRTYSSGVDIAGATGYTNGLPAALNRGGDWSDGSSAGAFALLMYGAPAATYTNGGARCCVGGP